LSEVSQSVDGLVVFTADLEVNTDGSLRSYKIDDLGHYNSSGKLQTHSALNIICHGVSIRRWDGSLVYDYKNCDLLIKEFIRIRNRNNWVVPNDNYVDFYAIARRQVHQGGKNRGAPCEKDGYYVSQVAKPIDPSKHVCDPERWVDALRIPAIVLPLDDRMKKTGVALHDLVLVRLPNSNRWVGAIVGDTNPNKIGEATVIAAMKLRGIDSVPANYRETVRLGLNRAEYIVFPKTASRIQKLTNSSFDEIQNQVAKLIDEHKLNERPKLCR
jgi:hypothetical protein